MERMRHSFDDSDSLSDLSSGSSGMIMMNSSDEEVETFAPAPAPTPPRSPQFVAPAPGPPPRSILKNASPSPRRITAAPVTYESDDLSSLSSGSAASIDWQDLGGGSDATKNGADRAKTPAADAGETELGALLDKLGLSHHHAALAEADFKTLDDLGLAQHLDLTQAGMSEAEATKLLQSPARSSRSLTMQLQAAPGVANLDGDMVSRHSMSFESESLASESESEPELLGA